MKQRPRWAFRKAGSARGLRGASRMQSGAGAGGIARTLARNRTGSKSAPSVSHQSGRRRPNWDYPEIWSAARRDAKKRGRDCMARRCNIFPGAGQIVEKPFMALCRIVRGAGGRGGAPGHCPPRGPRRPPAARTGPHRAQRDTVTDRDSHALSRLSRSATVTRLRAGALAPLSEKPNEIRGRCPFS